MRYLRGKAGIVTMFIALVIMLIASCKGGKKDLDKMTPEQILEVIDLKIKKDSKNPDLYYDRANILLKMGRANDAISDLTHAISLKGDCAKYHLLLGDAYFANGDVEHSYASMQRALELEPDNNEVYLKLGEIAFYSKDYDRAEDHLKHVLQKDKDNRTALFMTSFIYKEKGDTGQAVTLLTRVCDLYPDYEPAFEELGMLYASRKSPLAEEYYNTAISLEPNNTNALYGLAMYYQSIEYIDKADATYLRILDINEKDRDAWHNRGYLQLFGYGDYETAVEYFTRAIACDSAFVEAYCNRGCAYELMNDKKRAINDFGAALRIDPLFKPAQEGLKRVQ